MKKVEAGTEAAGFDAARFFTALSDPTRLRLLNLIGEDEVCVCFFVEVLGALQPKISRHLAFLRKVGIVGARRDGKWMHYRILRPSHPQAQRILEDVLEWLKKDPEMQLDRVRLAKVCLATNPPIQILGAPRPASVAARQ